MMLILICYKKVKDLVLIEISRDSSMYNIENLKPATKGSFWEEKSN